MRNRVSKEKEKSACFSIDNNDGFRPINLDYVGVDPGFEVNSTANKKVKRNKQANHNNYGENLNSLNPSTAHFNSKDSFAADQHQYQF